MVLDSAGTKKKVPLVRNETETTLKSLKSFYHGKSIFYNSLIC